MSCHIINTTGQTETEYQYYVGLPLCRYYVGPSLLVHQLCFVIILSQNIMKVYKGFCVLHCCPSHINNGWVFFSRCFTKIVPQVPNLIAVGPQPRLSPPLIVLHWTPVLSPDILWFRFTEGMSRCLQAGPKHPHMGSSTLINNRSHKTGPSEDPNQLHSITKPIQYSFFVMAVTNKLHIPCRRL